MHSKNLVVQLFLRQNFGAATVHGTPGTNSKLHPVHVLASAKVIGSILKTRIIIPSMKVGLFRGRLPSPLQKGEVSLRVGYFFDWSPKETEKYDWLK